MEKTRGTNINPKKMVKDDNLFHVQLAKELGLKEALAIGIGGMIGGGLFSVIGLTTSIAGSLVFLSFLLGGLIAISVGYSYVKLSRKVTSSGGSYSYVKYSFKNKFVGNWVGWLEWTGYLITCALYSYTFGVFAMAMILPGGDPVTQKIVALSLATVMIVFFTWINLKGVRETGNVQDIIVFLKVVILIFFISIAFIPAINRAPETLSWDNLFIKDPYYIIIGTAFTFVAFVGFNLIANSAEEMKDSNKMLSKGIYYSIIIVTIIYVLTSFVAIAFFGYTRFTGLNEREKEYSLAIIANSVLQSIGLGNTGLYLMGLGALFSTASAFNATLYGSSRLSFVMSREGVFPKFFEKINKKTLVPWVSIISISFITMLIIYTIDLRYIAESASVAFLTLFLLVSISNLKKRKETNAKIWPPLFAIFMISVSISLLMYHMIFEVLLQATTISEYLGFIFFIGYFLFTLSSAFVFTYLKRPVPTPRRFLSKWLGRRNK